MERVSEVVSVRSKSRRRLMRSGEVGPWRKVDVDIATGVGLERSVRSVRSVNAEEGDRRNRIVCKVVGVEYIYCHTLKFL